MELISGKMTSKGQITIPKEIRDKLNVNEGDQFRFLISEDNIKIEPIKKKLLSNAIGRITATEPIDLQKMRGIVQEKIAKELFSEEMDEQDD
ncbi:AbrB/MazE/SpoVT family DNA-binding domain-containing protein [Shouchella shacheensis]|uniref:AbrB/MazE/SpoVT family DNA-binding domain-containing protein n=1 Tax=Shouchella shacheensis TaxID=1649580 RepID=UPI000740424A|nr:AbrB/MazE/SpoVT family DNA-binding domain-containing protein [Shouchella shacheensis]